MVATHLPLASVVEVVIGDVENNAKESPFGPHPLS